MDKERVFDVWNSKLLKWVSGFLVVALMVSWIVLYATFSANYPGVVQMRKFYHEKVVEPKLLPDKLPYVMQVRGVKGGVYEYELWGRIESIDYTTYTMTIVDKSGGKWRVQMIHPPYHEANKIKIDISESGVVRGTGEYVWRTIPILIDRRAPEQTVQYLTVGDMINVIWKESMKISEVLRSNRDGGYMVVLPGDVVRPIRKVVGR